MTIPAPTLVTVNVPWACWYGDFFLELSWPEDYDVTVFEMSGGPALGGNEIRDRIRDTAWGPPLKELTAGRSSAAIAVDDISRPTPLAEVLLLLLEDLADISPADIRIIVALGAHRPMVLEELLKKLGTSVMKHFNVEQHHPYENLCSLGKSSRGTPVLINRTFLSADLKMAVGSVLPHPYAGFSGGAKLVLPGLAGIETLRANHRPAVTGISGGIADPEVEARHDIEEIARMVGLEYTCNVVVGASRSVLDVVCGDPVVSHREACLRASRAYRTPVQDAPFDVLVLNAYPKDTELLQAGNVFNCFRQSPVPLIREGGTLIITSCCSTGRGFHSLHGKEMSLYRPPVEKQYLNGCDLFFYSPNINAFDFQVSFWEAYRFFDNWSELVSALREKHPAAKVGIFPMAPVQMPYLE